MDPLEGPAGHPPRTRENRPPGLRPIPAPLAALLITLLTLAAYANSLHVPLHFDDVTAVEDNPTIRHLWPLLDPLSPPANGSGVHGRPLVNLSLAINYAIGGSAPFSYHATNLLMHLVSALLLFGLVRRTLERMAQTGEPARFRPAPPPSWVALTVALLWAVHPLLTESVTCVIQRTELLVACFYLLTLYALVRGADATRPARWCALSILACFAGMASKEVMVTAPVMALLYDRTFLAGSFAEALRRRAKLYAGLAAGWLLLAALMLGAPQRGGTVGFGLGVSSWQYLLTQCEAIVLYLKLSFWPHPLVMDYGTWLAPGWQSVWLQGLVVIALVAATLVAVIRRPRQGFLGCWFFGILAPSSSFVPLASQTIAEHRMYLPLAAVVSFVIVTATRYLRPHLLIAAGAALTLAFTVATVQRNRVYQSPETLWTETLARRPDNARAHNNLGVVRYRAGDFTTALTHYTQSLQLDPRVAQTHYNQGLALMQLGRLDEAAAALQAALQIAPEHPAALLNLGIVQLRIGSPDEAVSLLQRAVALQPASAEARFELGLAFARINRPAEAIAQYRAAVGLDPDHARALSNWGSALIARGDVAAGIERLQAALRAQPDLADVHFNLALAFAAQGDDAAAMEHYRSALRLDPRHVDAHLNLGIMLGRRGDLAESITLLTRAVELRPADPATHTNLGVALQESGRIDDAVRAYAEALRLAPGSAAAQYNLAYALLQARQRDAARTHFEAALRLDPDFAAARDMLRQMNEAP